LYPKTSQFQPEAAQPKDADLFPFKLFEYARNHALVKQAAQHQHLQDVRFNPFNYIEEIIDKVFDKHLPLFDFDNDTYSSM